MKNKILAVAITMPLTVNAATIEPGLENIPGNDTLFVFTAGQSEEYIPTKIENILGNNSLIDTPQMQEAMESIRERNRISTVPTLSDQTPDSQWEVKPILLETGATCVASTSFSVADARVINAQSQELTEDQRKALRYNTGSITITGTDSNDNAFIRLGFDTSDAVRIQTNEASFASISESPLPSVVIMPADTFTNAFSITALSNNGNTITYNIAEALPAQALIDCQEQAQNGAFDEAFDAIDDSVIAIMSIPADQERQDTLKSQFETGGLCNRGFDPEFQGRIEYSRFYSPATTVGFDARGHMQAGDLVRATLSRFSRSASLDGSPLNAPQVNGCAGQIEPVCTTIHVETHENGDQTLTYRFCSDAVPQSQGGYIPAGHSNSSFETYYIANQTIPVSSSPPRYTVNPTPTGPGTPGTPGTPVIPVTPIFPINPVNPEIPTVVDPEIPSPIPLPTSAWLLLGGVGALAFAAKRRRREEDVASKPAVPEI